MASLFSIRVRLFQGVVAPALEDNLMKKVIPLLVFVLLVAACVVSEPFTNSHVEGNVPEQAQFFQYLERDVKAYLKCEDVSVELLRKKPTQVGLAYPKYYAWVVGKKSGKVATQGAMRIAAIDKEMFEVTHYFTARELRENEELARNTFPKPLVAEVLRRAKQAGDSSL